MSNQQTPSQTIEHENEGVDDEQLLAREDDTIIARVFWWSIGIVGAIGVAVGITLFMFNTGGQAETVIEKDTGVIAELAQQTPDRPKVTFTDITEQAGIDYVHENAATGDKLLPETMGGGGAFFDYDNDGDQDIVFVNSSHWPDAELEDPKPTMALYENDGNGQFTNVTEQVGLDVSFYGMGCAIGDYDNDGDDDIFFTALGPNRLFRNDDGVFVDVTDTAGLAGDANEWSTSAGFFDYDKDGDLDLFVCNYVKWSREIDFEINYTLNGTDRAYGPPTNYEGAHPYFYENNGDGTFTDVSKQAGVQVNNPATGVPMSKALALVPMDINRDGWMDVVVANDTTRNCVFINNADPDSPGFFERGVEIGMAFSRDGSATGAMGIDAAHFRDDESMAVGIGNFSNEMTSFYVSQDNRSLFTDQSIIEGIGSPTRVRLSFGLFFFDYDLDGRLDLLQANGHLEEEISEVQPSQQYRQPAQLFWNAGPEARSTFVEVPYDAVGDLSRPIVGRGATYADIDSDGDLDVLLIQVGGPAVLLRNDQNLERHWLRVKLIGTQCNTNAIGSRVALKAGDMKQVRYVRPTRSYLSQVEMPVTFGLGDRTEVDELEITWPGGTTQVVPIEKVDHVMVVEQDVGGSG